jgi:hypothetical protein
MQLQLVAQHINAAEENAYQCLRFVVCGFAAATFASALICTCFTQQSHGTKRLSSHEDSGKAVMPSLNRIIKTEHSLSQEFKLSMADETMRGTADENKKLLPSVRGKRSSELVSFRCPEDRNILLRPLRACAPRTLTSNLAALHTARNPQS